jgi:hypothetical protein
MCDNLSNSSDISSKHLKHNYFTDVIVKNSHIVFASIIATLNILFYKNLAVSLVVVGVELSILAYFFLKNDITRYLGNYLIFLCLSLEFDVLVGTTDFYGFKNFKILGVNLGVICLVPILALTIFKKVDLKKIKTEFAHVYKFTTIIIFMNVIGLMMGLIEILIDDNNIQSMDNMFNNFIGECYTMIVFPLLIIITIAYILTWEKYKVDELKSYLVAILVGVVVSMIVSFTSGNYGYYSVTTLLVSNVIRYVPFMLLLPFYQNYKSLRKITIFAIIGVVLSLMYNATGKLIIMYMLVPFAVCMIVWQKKKFSVILLVVLMILPIVVFIGIRGAEILSVNSVLFKVKLNQALSILNIGDSNWLRNMPFSPQVRIIEFIDIVHEYIEKPWMILFGKGYMGTIKDHIKMLGTSMTLSGGYSDVEWSHGTFYGVHETLNGLFLYNGLFGLGFYLYMLRNVFTNFTKSPWILIGGFWFLMVYGYSVTMSAYGVTALLLGYIEIDNYKRYKYIDKKLSRK